ncbi:MAG: hypothetical protein H0X51_09670 [Parachlamydiaceae bacterium]|nr:hypothetical protein [Parachlamydiaceae bacterium]
MSGRNFSRSASSGLSWSRYSCDAAFSCGRGLSQGFLDPIGTVSGYGKNLWNYNYSGKTWGQIGRDFNQHVCTAERLGEVGGLALNCVAVAKGVQAGIRGGSAACALSRQFFGRQPIKRAGRSLIEHQAVGYRGKQQDPWSFPENPNDLLPEFPRDHKGRIETSDYMRVTPHRHAQKPGETYNPRHHGQHYHIEVKRNLNGDWTNSNIQKLRPTGYIPKMDDKHGSGTGFLPGELFPGK